MRTTEHETYEIKGYPRPEVIQRKKKHEKKYKSRTNEGGKQVELNKTIRRQKQDDEDEDDDETKREDK